ncbi:hypothetical protein KP509_20G084400 [Ceratopteris richardii]|nr:hypothetical protein KP509_20G084400 [Ceratopteris richardii]
MLKMVTDFFENSRMASTLCSIVLYCIEQARGQWGSMDLTLAEFPQSGETLGFAKQQSITKCFSEMVSMENPFTDEQACDIFTNVRSRYTLLSEEVEGSRDMISRQAKERRRWRQWLIGMTALMVAGATLVVVVVTMHVVAGMAAAPIMLGMAAVARDKFQESGERSFKMQMRKAKVERVMSKCKLQQNKAGMTVNDDMDMTGLNMDMSGVLVGGMEVDTMLQDGTTVIEGKAADRGRFSAVIGDPLGECCRLAPIWDHRRTRGWWCWGSTTLAGQSAKLDALACGIFLVNNMLDTLSCLVRGLQEDWEYNRKLIEFGCVHCKEAACLQQVGRQLLRSHTNLYKQLTNLEEQVLVFLLFINKARHTVLQKFPNKVKNSQDLTCF